MATLFESYKNRLALSEKMHMQAHNGAKMSDNKKLVVAKCLENINRCLNEAFESSVGTQRSDLGAYKKFALNLVTVALPNLIAHDLVIVHPMSSYSGYINYVEYVAGIDKGDVKQGELFNSPFGLGEADKKIDEKYTSARVVETAAGTELELAWTPVVKKAFKTITVAGKEVEFDDRKQYSNEELATVAYKDVKIMKAAGGDAVYANVTGDKKVTGLAEGDRVAYVYNNEVIPQEKLPTVKAVMKTMPLVAKARRIAIYFSQFAAFQAKTDYGFDLGDQLAEKAVGQLSYEIDNEVVELLVENAEKSEKLKFNTVQRVGESMFERYEAFAKVIADATQIIYDRTKRFAPTYMIIASNVLPVVQFCKGFTAAPIGAINGPYMCGTIGGLKVYVSPAMEPGKFVFGVNGSDMASSAAVYAPYMPIVPTQLLGFADGTMSQGWSTLYDLKILNKNLLVAGEIYEDEKEVKNTALNVDTKARG